MRKFGDIYLIISLLLFSVILFAQSQTQNEKNSNILELPITEKQGYGNFYANMRGLSPYLEIEDNPWKNTYVYPTGVPKDWTDVKYGHIPLNFYQSVYQNYYSGKITKEWFEHMKKSMQNPLDSSKFSKTPIKCEVTFAMGKDNSGATKIIVDANNNLDFSDDKAFTPVEYQSRNRKINRDSMALKASINVTYERLKQGKIVHESMLVFITNMSEFNRCYYNFPKYGIAKLDDEEIMINPNGFGDISYELPEIALVDHSWPKGYKIESKNLIPLNGYIEIKGKTYKNLGVDKNRDVLLLERIDNQYIDKIFGTTEGYRPYPINGNDFTTNNSISLEDLKGKYVLLDFWATWCVPCIKEMPHLKKLYSKIDRSKFEIVGIVAHSKPKMIKEMIEKHDITWPQILADDTNKIVENYGVNSYPTTFLISQDGKIIDKGLKGEILEEKILSLINEN
jgi:thiol-disulfide isomerase/thioredoxin